MAAEPGLALQSEQQMAQLSGTSGPVEEQPLLGQQIMAVNAEVDVQTTSDVAQGVSSSSLMGKPLDARLLDRPQGFDGDVRRWPSWRLKFEAWLTMVDGDFGQWIREARLANLPVPWISMSSRAKVLGAFLYAALVTLMIGSLLEVVAAVPDSNGWEAYRRVCSEVDPRAASQKLQVLEDLLEPQFGEAGNFYAKWLSWDCLGKDV